MATATGMEIWFQSSGFVIGRDAGGVFVRRRARGAVVLGLGGVLLGAASYAAGHALDAEATLSSGETGPARALLWLGVLFAGMSGLLIALGPIAARRGHFVFDPVRRTLWWKGVAHAFGALGPIRINTLALGGRDFVNASLTIDGKSVYLTQAVGERDRQALSAALARISAVVGDGAGGGAAAEPAPGPPPAASFERGVRVGALLGTGAVWAIVGRLALPDYVLTRPGGTFGTLLWPFGLWLMAAGVLELCGLGILGWKNPRPARLPRLLIGVVWMGSYLLLTWRSWR